MQVLNAALHRDKLLTLIQYNWQRCQSTGAGCNIAGTPDSLAQQLLPGTCEQGAVPDMYIAVQSPDDVVQGLAFARNNNIPLVVKNSGHDYKGRSSGAGSLALWVKAYDPPLQFRENFVPEACAAAAGNVITYSTGASSPALVDFAEQHDSFLVTGASESVSAGGGWLAGGGHSPLTPSYGLGVDNVQQLRAVLPNGTYVTANRCKNQDIFFALRGGGGSTFGVTMEVSATAHPTPVTGFQLGFWAFGALSQDDSTRLLNILVQNARIWADLGFGGYSFPAPGTTYNNTVSLVSPKVTLPQARLALQPLTEFARSVGKPGMITNQKSWKTVLMLMNAGSEHQAGMSYALSSRLVPRANFKDAAAQQSLVSALAPIATAFATVEKEGLSTAVEQHPLFICLTTPSAYDVGTDANSSSVTPAWRDAIWHVIGVNRFSNDVAGAEARAEYQKAHDALQPLFDLTPGSGTYQNEANPYDDHPEIDYWGQEKYEKLLGMKQDLDPENVLTCHQCVGWNPTDERYSCYP